MSGGERAWMDLAGLLGQVYEGTQEDLNMEPGDDEIVFFRPDGVAPGSVYPRLVPEVASIQSIVLETFSRDELAAMADAIVPQAS